MAAAVDINARRDAFPILPCKGRWQPEGLTEGVRRAAQRRMRPPAPSTIACGGGPPPGGGSNPPHRAWISFHPFPDGSRKLASTLP